MKQCTKCLLVLDLDNFYNKKTSKDGKRSYCKACTNKQNKEYIKDKPELKRAIHLKNRYGMTLEQYDGLAQVQMSRCAICNKRDNNLFVDHCHKTGDVRGLLCRDCNTGLGMFADNVDNLKQAIKYLENAHEDNGNTGRTS